ncbi:hypothetical protein [Goodfellowiella coeruleoviolacea]|uniref:Uncharacterized protein n=1 Tax=Goodfellowiella coeruleoviolacea TaxID=334858 RepID=A0AAE3GIC0_9PSEU|nr:hypothetical protein [Goodfellowiella coeruleoviolacea]MCP2167937.1 hypothetical protein [Goodfellowiella coeruleoviolacea]
MTHPEPHARPRWQRTGHARFPLAAVVDGQWWVLRMNSFPDHARWTLFINSAPRWDIDDMPSPWKLPDLRSAPLLEPGTAEEALAPIQHLVAYGSEVGEPCDGPFCCG